MVRTEEIDELDSALNAEREKLVASDGMTNYMRECSDEIDDDTFEKWMDYHFSICERQDMTGVSNHTLDILRKL